MNQTLTKSDIVESVHKANRFSFTTDRAKETVEILIEIVKRTLSTGDDVLVSGFGKFCVKDKRKRRGRNPANGESMMLDPRRVVTFKCSGRLRGIVNGNRE